MTPLPGSQEKIAMLRLFIIFVILAVFSFLGIALFGVELSNTSYWDHHGFVLLIFLTFFPRLALLFSSIPFGGIFWWLGLIFCPHYLVAILATLNYWPSNPFLVCISWFVALGGEFGEKYYLKKRARKAERQSDKIIDMDPADVWSK